jgi:hypothetical protein
VEKIRLLHAGTPIKDTDTPTSIDASGSTVLHMVLIMWATTPVLFKCMPSGDVITLNCGGKQSFKSIRQQLAVGNAGSVAALSRGWLIALLNLADGERLNA